MYITINQFFLNKVQKTSLIFFLFMISSGSFSNERNTELDLYDLGSALSRCSGDYEFASMFHRITEPEDTSLSKLLHEHSNGWLTAGIANYYFSGLTREASVVSAEGKRDVVITQWSSALESLSNNNYQDIDTMTTNLLGRVAVCNKWDNIVVESQKKLKKEWLSRPKD